MKATGRRSLLASDAEQISGPVGCIQSLFKATADSDDFADSMSHLLGSMADHIEVPIHGIEVSASFSPLVLITWSFCHFFCLKLETCMLRLQIDLAPVDHHWFPSAEAAAKFARSDRGGTTTVAPWLPTAMVGCNPQCLGVVPVGFRPVGYVLSMGKIKEVCVCVCL